MRIEKTVAIWLFVGMPSRTWAHEKMRVRAKIKYSSLLIHVVLSVCHSLSPSHSLPLFYPECVCVCRLVVIICASISPFSLDFVRALCWLQLCIENTIERALWRMGIRFGISVSLERTCACPIGATTYAQRMFIYVYIFAFFRFVLFHFILFCFVFAVVFWLVCSPSESIYKLKSQFPYTSNNSHHSNKDERKTDVSDARNIIFSHHSRVFHRNHQSMFVRALCIYMRSACTRLTFDFNVLLLFLLGVCECVCFPPFVNFISVAIS